MYGAIECDRRDDDAGVVDGGGGDVVVTNAPHAPTATSCLATITLPKDDYRTMHVAKVLGCRNGDALRVGVVRDRRRRAAARVEDDDDDRDGDDRAKNAPVDDGGRKGDDGRGGRRDAYPRATFLEGLLTDQAIVSWLPEGRVKKAEPTKNGDPPGSLRIVIPHPPMTTLWDDRAHVAGGAVTSSRIDECDDDGNDDDDATSPCDDAPRVSLLLALPRPLQLRRILPMISQFGVDRILLTNANKVPKDYFGSSVLREPKNVRDLLVEGLSISGDVSLPDVIITRRLRSYLEDELDDMFPVGEVARVIAHPRRRRTYVVSSEGGRHDGNDDEDYGDGDDDGGADGGERYDVGTRRMADVVFPNDDGKRPRRMLIAVGPEGGWEEPYELDMFERCGFQKVHIGSRVLRSDVAVVSLLALANEACDA
jgi:16S rRNA U1498 N3-methylase RsmE